MGRFDDFDVERAHKRLAISPPREGYSKIGSLSLRFSRNNARRVRDSLAIEVECLLTLHSARFADGINSRLGLPVIGRAFFARIMRMLACDLVMDIRASRCVSRDQVLRLERVVFGNGEPGYDELDLLDLIDTYAMRADATWTLLLARAVKAREALEACAAPRSVRRVAA